ncbi:MAG TPA: nitrate reductase [Gammaproteobacteria bacterium]|nr:nitrate reductase [Gammaproteobacteria bacterium]
MDPLLSFARGPMLQIAIAVFCFGVLWRLLAIFLLRHRRSRSPARHGRLRALIEGALVAGTRSWPHKVFIRRTGYGEALGYAYHLGLFIVILLFAPHITFFKGIIGVGWPALPSSLINIIAVLTLALLLGVLVRRISKPVLRMLSNFDDYFSWLLVTATVVTGLMATAHLGGPYSQLLAWHILSVDALLIWFPFGKLMHAFYIFPSRVINGYTLARKGGAS